MMLLLTVFYSIPEFDVSSFFLLSCSTGKLNGIGNVTDLNGEQTSTVEDVATSQDSERIRLKPSGSGGHLKYSQQVNETNELQVSSEKLKLQRIDRLRS